MYFATYFQESAISKELVEACGDRATIILDGRESASTHHHIAIREGKKRGYVGYKLHCGQSFTRVQKSTGLVRIK